VCQDSDNNGERPNTTPISSLPLSRKTTLDKEESSSDAYPRNENFPGNKTATGSAEFVVDLELVDEVEARQSL
jgi:hypothetical protein